MRYVSVLDGAPSTGIDTGVEAAIAAVTLAQSVGTTSNGEGVPQMVIVGLGVLGLIGLSFVLRNALKSGDNDGPPGVSGPASKTSELDGEQYKPGGPQYRERGQQDRMSTAGPNSERGISALTHVLAFLFWILGPGFIYLISTDPFVKQNSANALNWQIILTLYLLLSALLIPAVGVIVIVVLGILNLTFVLTATIKAIGGEAWEYPLTPKLL